MGVAVGYTARPDPSRVCVAHLARRKNGIKPFLRFIEAYTSRPPGIPCDLLIIYKGFPGNRVPPEYSGVLGDLPHIAYFVDDTGFDILPYFKAAKEFAYEYFCFLNSYSVILHEGWLRNLHMHIRGNNVGIAGATGSWQSIYSGSIEWKQRGFPRWKRVLGAPWKLFLKMYFDPFPNYHVRTNAFMISRDLMRKIRHGNISTKMAAWRFESGKDSMTKQVMEMGMRVVIVGRDGKAYDKEDWNRSGIFWQGEQENLLVADKQTLRYQLGDERERNYLRHFAWWDRLEPHPMPGSPSG
jgi:hypothetical protein